MDCFKAKSQHTFNHTVMSLCLFALSASCLAEQEIQTKTPPNALLFTLNKPVDFRWSGAYLGGYIGGAWGNAKVTTTAGTVTDTSYFTSNATINAVAQKGSQTFIPSAFIGGVQFGDNWMFKNYIYGFVLDYGSLSLHDDNEVQNSTQPDDSGSYSIKTSFNTDWMYTIRGRLGWAPNLAWPAMIYGTGGLAVTKLNVSNQFSDTNTLAGVGAGSNSTTINGWTIGMGIEFPVTQNLTINSEYLDANFGSVAVKSSVYNTTAGFGIDYQSLVSSLSTRAPLYANFLKIGLNYKFNSDPIVHNQK